MHATKFPQRAALVFAAASAVLAAAAIGTVFAQQQASSISGQHPMRAFDFSNASVPRAEIRHGGPAVDGIPAIRDPKFVSVEDADYLRDQDIVIGIVRNGDARAYPLRILVWHEIVNDDFGTLPVAVTYCPLCGTAMVFDRRAGGETRTFGVSGLLYNSDVLMYDHESKSLWSQLAMKAVSGPAVEAPLAWLPSDHMTWVAWRHRYPEGKV